MKIQKQGVDPQGSPPPGLKGKCDRCGADLETTENEQEYRVQGPTGYGGKGSRGWYVRCPICRNEVYIDYPYHILR